jgi:1,4-dihydroxy-6-naphthoate synthase
MAPTSISLAYSVDADDAFMFHALREGHVASPGLVFSHRRGDTAALNQIALAGEADVVAISAGAYPLCAERYLLLPHGGSIGRGFGPVVVARSPMAVADLAGKRVGIPGLTTTAWMVLRLIAPEAVPVIIPIVPFGRIFDAVTSGEVDAALVIHEGRLLYPERGLALVVDLGVWWQAQVGLPLPLGVNVIRRALGGALVAKVSALLRQSIRFALEHRDSMIATLAAEDRGERSLADPKLIDTYLALYANADTAEMPDDARRGIEALFSRARAAGFLPGAGGTSTVEWAP